MNEQARFYTAQQVKSGEQKAAKDCQVEMYALMERAGLAVFQTIKRQFPSARRVLVCCGGGNNGGDGYVVARMLLEAGVKVELWSAVDIEKLTGDAKSAYQAYISAGGRVEKPALAIVSDVELIVDAILRTGLTGEVRVAQRSLIELINAHSAKVISVDIPSGLCADTGSVLGVAIEAFYTVTFIGMKQGLVTGQARNHTGKFVYDGLGVSETFHRQNVPATLAIDSRCWQSSLPKRKPASHKSTHGKVALIGGEQGFSGAIILSGNASARSGAGLTAVLTNEVSIVPMLNHCPEVMVSNWQSMAFVAKRVDWSDAIALGPGLSTSNHARSLFELVRRYDKAKVLDADALTLLAENPFKDDNRILTPHPGEAARLLACSIKEVESNRFQAVTQLQQIYGGVIVLKGAGTLVHDGQTIYVCTAGNAGMGSGGMGDVLTGVIVSLLAQGMSLSDAALTGVQLHSVAADELATEFGSRGLLASDLIPAIRRLMNQ
ncbi:NAD(P)H-hydrate dehydratase [Vibrio paucivorans]|uniref:Bifunctional NAD(P)H-hydrate repair enzyme n=1 Tax=Vibrio paucivorans TaxID=2829489 RepID=A0A9X3CH03_9VIBR|nr:NAD(P)H-hydrate dehydratase [Vibrio paucivorans]MCW8335702.1 NAD(P)H-hydrate dehydratase [Vibrio paucivorans]